jgi:hypothetical protein
MPFKYELQNIISGTGRTTKGNTIQTIAHHLRKSKGTSADAQKEELIKEQETAALLDYANKNNFFYTSIDHSRYLAEGAEQKVYLDRDDVHVVKTNDGIFYLTWKDYFNSLLLHNYFFPATAYELIGFVYENANLYAAVRQPYIKANETTNIDSIKELMLLNGFSNTKNNDYLNKELGIILEDLHDENVLTNNNVLFFVDTVFYLTKEFYFPPKI